MYKNLNCGLIGISGRQSEVIELALTYGFQGLDVDMADLFKRSQRTSYESASKFLTSSKLRIGGYNLPIELDASDEAYATKLAQLHGLAEVANRTGATTGYLEIPTATDRLPYHEYFDVIRKRIDEVAGVLGKENQRLALHFSALSGSLADKQFKFVNDVEGFLALFRACTADNVGIIFDSWNWHLGGGAADQFNELALEKVFAVRLGDCEEGLDPKTATIKDRLLPGSQNGINNAGYLRRFHEFGAELPVAAMGGTGGTGVTRDSSVANAQDALDQVFDNAGIPVQTRKPDSYAEAAPPASN